MRHSPGHNGFVLIIVVFLLGATSIAIAIWAAQTRDLVIQTRLLTAQTGLDNTIDSAAQWAALNPKILKITPEGQWIRLKLNELQLPGLECYYRVLDKNASQTDIEITATGNFRSHPIKKTVRLSL